MDRTCISFNGGAKLTELLTFRKVDATVTVQIFTQATNYKSHGNNTIILSRE